MLNFIVNIPEWYGFIITKYLKEKLEKDGIIVNNYKVDLDKYKI